MPTDLLLLPAASSDRRRCADVLAQAFAADPHTVGMLPPDDHGRRLRWMFTGAFDETLAAGGDALLALDADRTLLGVALWEGPGRHVPLGATVRASPAYLRAFGRHRIIDALRTERSMLAHRPALAHWYLRAIGVTEAARGRGVASALIRARTDVADHRGLGCYLESSTEANVPYYEGRGFAAIGPVPAVGTLDPIGMWRVPQ